MARNQVIKVSFDGGYHSLKSCIGGDEKQREIIPHGVVRIEDADWEAARETMRDSKDFIRVDGVPYAVGQQAFNYRFIKSKRAARYKPGYYDVQYWRMLMPFLRETKDMQYVFASASYPPADMMHATKIQELLMGERIIETLGGKQFLINTEHVVTFPEISGGMMYFLTDDLNLDQRRKRFKEMRMIGIDVGGGTTDILPIELDIQPQLAIAESNDIGAGTIEDAFRRQMLTRYKEQFPAGIHDTVLRKAFKERQIRIGKDNYEPLDKMVDSTINAFFSQLDAAIEKVGGLYNYNSAVLTGGGIDLLYAEFEKRYGQNHSLLLLGKRGDMQFANVVGGHRILDATVRRNKKEWRQ